MKWSSLTTEVHPPQAGDTVFYGGRAGTITRIHRQGGNNIWVLLDETNTEIMFSHRRDFVWRQFPGAADGPALELRRKKALTR
jgi:hypothetical protein